MILSRVLAKRRIAAGVRPTWVGAWSPVAFDAACLAMVIALLFGPARSMTEVWNFPIWATVLALMAVVFIPMQGVLILSSLWAAKSRYVEKDGNSS